MNIAAMLNPTLSSPAIHHKLTSPPMSPRNESVSLSRTCGKARSRFSDLEDAIICEGVAKGLTWGQISGQLPHRKRATCFNRYRTLQGVRKSRKRVASSTHKQGHDLVELASSSISRQTLAFTPSPSPPASTHSCLPSPPALQLEDRFTVVHPNADGLFDHAHDDRSLRYRDLMQASFSPRSSHPLLSSISVDTPSFLYRQPSKRAGQPRSSYALSNEYARHPICSYF